MNYVSVCSGIEAATAAWHPLGWTPLAFAEIEKFPSAVLAHHYPNVPNLGDMTKFHEWTDFSDRTDVLVGGCPCQAFSLAGLREGLNDPRGNLTLTYLGVAEKLKPRWIVYENVPGILSDRTNAFGCLLAGLEKLGYGWAYRILDAQYFGLAQRRKRVFVVAYLGDWTRAAEVLFERGCVCGHPAPRRQARQEITGTLSARASGGGGLGTDFDLAGGLQSSCGGADENDAAGNRLVSAVIAPTLNAHFGAKQGLENQHIDGGGGYLSSAVAGTLSARDCKSARMDADTNHLIPTRRGGFPDVAHSLRAEGFDASEDGTGRGTPLVAVPIQEPGGRTGKSTNDASCGIGIGDDGDVMYTLQAGKCHGVAVGPIPFDTTQITSKTNRSQPKAGDPSHPITAAGHAPAIVFSCKDSGGDAGEVAPTLRSMGHAQSHQNGGGQLAAILPNLAVRRLTPDECEALQGFPRKYTDIPYGPKRKPAPDGPRYKALGNSMAVPCMAWIGRRIAMVDAKCRTPVLEIDW